MFSNSKISLYNWIVIGLMAVTFIVTAKMIFSKYQVPGVSQLFAIA